MGWRTMRALLVALQCNQLRDLESGPLEIGPVGPPGFVIATV